MRLVDLSPRWDCGREILVLLCPCGEHYIRVPFVSGIMPTRWNKDSDDFATMTVTPSVQIVGGCRTHFSIMRGEIVP